NSASFRSEARLYVRFVISEGRTPSHDQTTKWHDPRRETIMTSEVQILSSMDLARQVAMAVGPERILAKTGGTDPTEAALAVYSGLTVRALPWSSVIQVLFEHSDPSVVQPVLRQVIDEYM